ncbi:putative methyltransferase-like protein 15 homolog [Tubulanus polymorphus]|uniref:putative methyltransferase-like protein 15 homolog n=1 Tax=Tubulanus polymorphus TaxID=672921 RepID=UPI003DA51FCE
MSFKRFHLSDLKYTFHQLKCLSRNLNNHHYSSYQLELARLHSHRRCLHTSSFRTLAVDFDVNETQPAAAAGPPPPVSCSAPAAAQSDHLHVPVMAEQSIKLLDPSDNKCFIDMTFGAGGHTKRILAHAPKAKIFALDRDPTADGLAKKLQQQYSNVTPVHGKFTDLKTLLDAYDVRRESVDGILFDIGASSMQFDSTARGFAISRDAPLDMRMDGVASPEQPSAGDVVNYAGENDLFQILKMYGEEKHARDIARAIVESRQAFGKIASTKQLASIVELVYQGNHKLDSLGRHAHVATKTFQALRIFVNNELNELNNGLILAHDYLRPGGVCVVISFHSLEDRIVKRHFHGIDMDKRFNAGIGDHLQNSAFTFSNETMSGLMKRKRWSPISRKVTSATDDEIVANPRSRSAKLRAAVKLTTINE